MSIYATFDGGGQIQIASNSGWSIAGDWIDSLDERHAELIHLWEHGWSDDSPLVSQQIAAALEESPPDADTINVMQELRGFSRVGDKGSVLIVGGGVESSGDEDSEADED